MPKTGRGNRKLVGRKAGRASAGDALQMADALNKAKAKTGALVASVKTVSAFDKKRSRKSAAAVQEQFHAMKGAGVGVEDVPTCLACCSLNALMFVTLSDDNSRTACLIPVWRRFWSIHL